MFRFDLADIDNVTPLCSQVTYEGLLDETFGIKCGEMFVRKYFHCADALGWCGFAETRSVTGYCLFCDSFCDLFCDSLRLVLRLVTACSETRYGSFCDSLRLVL